MEEKKVDSSPGNSRTVEIQLEITNMFFSGWRELESEFKRYGFDRDKHQILFEYEADVVIGLRACFRISEKIDLVGGDESERIDFYISAFISGILNPKHPEYRIESINLIHSKDVEINGETITIPLGDKKYLVGNDPLPTKDEILKEYTSSFQNERFSKARTILEKMEKCYGSRLTEKIKTRLGH